MTKNKSAKVVTIDQHNKILWAMESSDGVVSKGNKVEPFKMPLSIFPPHIREDMTFDYVEDGKGNFGVVHINTQI